MAAEQTDEHAEPGYCPFKGRCEHPDCLRDVEQCGSALMASARSQMPAIDGPPKRVRRPPAVGERDRARDDSVRCPGCGTSDCRWKRLECDQPVSPPGPTS